MTMKEYKVGDTIYVKDTVTDIDCDDSTATYYGNHHGWLDNSCIIDELPADPVKPVLPKEVANELEYAKNYRHRNFYGYLRAASSDATSMDCPATTRFLDCFWGEKIKILSDAWYNGYTVEKPKRYVLPMPGTDYHNIQMHGNAQYYAIKGTGNWRPDAIALGTGDAVKHGYTVTQSDIDVAPAWVKSITPIEVCDEQ